MTDYSTYTTIPDAAYLGTLHAAGQSAGLRAGVFAKIGDSISYWSSFMGPLGLDTCPVVWGEHYHLRDTLNYFRATIARRYNSFLEQSTAALRGGTTADLLASYSNFLSTYRYYTSLCTGKTTLECAYDTLTPAFAVILIGTVSLPAGVSGFQAGLQSIVDITVARNIIPILTTIPPRLDGSYNIAGFNSAVSQVATSSDVPLIDWYAAMQALPGQGIGSDGVHPSWSPNGNTADFSAAGLNYGWNVRNIITLEALRMVRAAVAE